MSIHSLPPSIPILTDLPVSSPRMGFEKYISAISAAIRGGDPAQFTIGLYGPWGKGKSSILQGIQKELEPDEHVTVVPFDAWRYEKAPDLLVPLVWRMRQVLNQKQHSHVRNLLTALSRIEVEFYGVTVKQGGSQKSALTEDRFLSALDALSDLGSNLAEGHRIAVLVDDLDRCSPGRVMEVIESIRILMDVPGFVFVLAIDYDVLKRAINERYKNVDADQFVEKIVQVPFRIPELSDVNDSVVATIVPNWGQMRETWFTGVSDADIDALARHALRSNPRQIKRVINSGMLARHINWSATRPEEIRLLLASLAMQQRWPDEFDEMIQVIARSRDLGSEAPTDFADVLRELEWAVLDEADQGAEEEGTEIDHDLRVFQSMFLRPTLELRMVEETLRLASKTSGIGPVDPPDDDGSGRRRAAAAIIRENDLIPPGAYLTLDLKGCVRGNVRNQVDRWMQEDFRRGQVQWAPRATRPLVWAAEPGRTFTASGLVNRILELATGKRYTFNAANAWHYDGKRLSRIADEFVADGTRPGGEQRRASEGDSLG